MHNNIKERIRKISREQNGAAMVIVLCVIAVLLALAVSILLAASSALNVAKNNVTQEQCKVMATTFSNVVDDAMEDPQGQLCQYLKNSISGGSWASSDSSYHAKTFDLDNTYFDTSLEIYWEEPSGGLSSRADNTVNYSGVQVYIDVICKLNQVEYHVQSRYGLSVEQLEQEEGQIGSPEEKWTWTLWGKE